MIYAVSYGGPTDALNVAGVRIPRGETREVDMSDATAAALRGMRRHRVDVAEAGVPSRAPDGTFAPRREPDIPDPDIDPGTTEED